MVQELSKGLHSSSCQCLLSVHSHAIVKGVQDQYLDEREIISQSKISIRNGDIFMYGNMFLLLLADAFCVYPNNEYLVYQWIP